MLSELVRKVLGSSKGQTGSDDTLDTTRQLQLAIQELTHVGSEARLINKVELEILPLSAKSCMKKRAVSMLTPMAANTMAKLSSSPSFPSLAAARLTRPACRQIWAAI